MNDSAKTGFTANHTFVSTRGWHIDFGDAHSAQAFYEQLMLNSGWGKRTPDKQPAQLEGTQVIFKTPMSKQRKALENSIT